VQFTREPIIETIITPKEGYKLVVRNSKGSSNEEFFVDAVQVVTVGSGCFFRSLEKPKPFLVPASDYEVIETREAKMVLKIPGSEKGGIKIGGGRQQNPPKQQPERAPEKEQEESSPEEQEEDFNNEEAATSVPQEPRGQERRKDGNKRRMRRRRGGERFERAEGESNKEDLLEDGSAQKPREDKPAFIIPPPSTLISETIARYKDIPGFASAFFEKEKEEVNGNVASETMTPNISEDSQDDDTGLYKIESTQAFRVWVLSKPNFS
jgi:hypothetical protein